MGHEFCGEIVDYGPGTRRSRPKGSMVCSVPIRLKPTGAEFIGYSGANPGGFGEYMLLTEDHLIDVPNGLSPDLAALTEPMAVGARGVALARLTPEDVPLVIGCGPIGLAVIASLKLRGVGPIVASDFSAARRRLAAAIGADVTVDPAEASPFESWRSAASTGQPNPGVNLPGWLVGSGLRPAVVFDCVGARGMIRAIMREAPQDTRIVVLGLCRGEDAFEPFEGIKKELSLVFSNSYTRQEFADTLAAIADGRLDAGAMITGRIGLAGVAQAFADLERPEVHAKIIVRPGGN